jgi:hypothetical protein
LTTERYCVIHIYQATPYKVMNMKEIVLSRGLRALVDDEDYEALIKEGRWSAIQSGPRFYASHRSKRTGMKEYMHRFIMKPERGMDIDHINGNPLDNRKENLRICTRSINNLNKNVAIRMDNKSGVKGVYFATTHQKWKAEYCVNKRKFHLGFYPSLELAAAARKKAELRVAEGLSPK